MDGGGYWYKSAIQNEMSMMSFSWSTPFPYFLIVTRFLLIYVNNGSIYNITSVYYKPYLFHYFKKYRKRNRYFEFCKLVGLFRMKTDIFSVKVVSASLPRNGKYISTKWELHTAQWKSISIMNPDQPNEKSLPMYHFPFLCSDFALCFPFLSSFRVFPADFDSSPRRKE